MRCKREDLEGSKAVLNHTNVYKTAISPSNILMDPHLYHQLQVCAIVPQDHQHLGLDRTEELESAGRVEELQGGSALISSLPV